MESEAEPFFWPNAGRNNEIVSIRAIAANIPKGTLRLLVKVQLLFTLWLVFRARQKKDYPC